MKAFSKKTLEFTNGVEKCVAKIGFNTLPDWAAQDPYFATCEAAGHISSFEGASTFSEAEKQQQAEEKAAYEARIAVLEARVKAEPEAEQEEKASKKK